MSDAPYQPMDRRPITARSWPVWQSVVSWLVRRGVSANTISIVGMAAGIAAGAALAATSSSELWTRFAWITGAALIQVRLLANLLDGMVAIESGKASAVGELYNEVPDRVSDTAILVGTGWAVGGSVFLGCVAACAALFTAYVRAMGKAAGAAQEFCGPMAKQHRMALVTGLALYCGLSPVEWQPVWDDPRPYGLTALALVIVILGCVVTSIRRLLRIAAELRRLKR